MVITEPMAQSITPWSGVSPPHSCRHCQRFIIHLYDKPAPNRYDKPGWSEPNHSQLALAAKIFGTSHESEEIEAQREEFCLVTNGISLFDASLDDLARYSKDGCIFFNHFWQCMAKDDDYPSKFVIGARILTEYNLEFGFLDLDLLLWESLLGREDDECPDNTYTMLSIPGQ
jgi:hypothetical protein